ncbi:hypothetical protein Ahy_A07g034033 [Arachis hypogaea]|uniref:Replication protein A 70 kDa DNA-binding subunit B/D first OB fold domain-containing protein n=1 Tax=Arachis hypogaea TaxID=3818 RepID=A0A445CAP0_ARAHY|nr:hypothetical protein Ahy_A07g034033 [Arachis hypogaea]
MVPLMGWNINSHLPHNFFLPYGVLGPTFLFPASAGCCHSPVPASFFSVVAVTPIRLSPSSTRFFYPHALFWVNCFLCECFEVVNERRDSSGRHAREYTVYTGGVGTAYLFSFVGVARFSTISSDEHHKIQATIEDDFISTFIDRLKEGEVFIISDFKVIPNLGLVRVTRHRFRILFKCSTSVLAAASIVIPNPGLSVTSMDQILQKCIDYEYLIGKFQFLKYKPL